MKTELEEKDVETIAQRVLELLKPSLSVNGNHGSEDIIFDVEGLADYLRVSKQWIYERTHLKEIPHLKIDGQLRFRKKYIDKWLSSYDVPATNTYEKIMKATK